jgi:hypothetical protein
MHEKVQESMNDDRLARMEAVQSSQGADINSIKEGVKDLREDISLLHISVGDLREGLAGLKSKVAFIASFIGAVVTAVTSFLLKGQ